MKRIPKRMEQYLLEISPHDGEPTYLKDRFASIPFDESWREQTLLQGLEDHGMIEGIGQRVEIEQPTAEGFSNAIKLPGGFMLTADAICYLEQLPRQRLFDGLRIAGEVVTFAGGISAIVNLVLYALWH